jgi:predicted molibdopterin-dependent oxidoreductase YjgC
VIEHLATELDRVSPWHDEAGLPDTERVIAALGHLEALAVLDVRRNATTAAGTHVIACTDQLERVDVTFLDLFNPAVAVQFSDAVVESPNSRQPMWRTIATLAQSLGFDILGDNADPASVSNDTVLSRAARGLDIDDLRRTGGPRVEASAMYGWVQSKLPTGRWQLAPPPLVAQLQAITHPPGLVVTPRRQLRHQNAQPFRTGDVPDALMHPDDAFAAGVSDGEIVEISSATGVLRIELRVTDSTARGSVSIPHGWEEVNVNRLMSRDDLDELTGMPRLSGTAVTVAPIHAWNP